ncbi:ScbR family autoregulator-binding transcription factor [Actinomadura kijaniata]|nr:ScbR family autoregulator-binding transcription factor [Actinomadura namibiensis]
MQERATLTRRIILNAAAETFEERGYEGTSIRDIAESRNMSKGAVYFHFSSKEDLALAVINEQRFLWPDLVNELRGLHPRAMNLLLALTSQVADVFLDNVLVRASLRLAFETCDKMSPWVPSLLVDWADIIDRLLSEAQEAGDVLPEVDTRYAAEFIVGSFAGCQRISEIETGRADLRWRVAMMWHHLLPTMVTEECLADMEPVLRNMGQRAYTA